jgi:alkylated DNA repair dioxygenase AlkB
VTILQGELFETGAKLPEGFVYRREFITAEEEAALLEKIRALPLAQALYKEFTAKRRTLSYGGQYDFSVNKLQSAPPVPEFLLPLRNKAAAWIGIDPGAFVHALVSEYEADTPLGWHRDVSNFEIIVGVSLRGTARMRLRPYRPNEKQRRADVIVLELEPRSAYVMRDTARWGWQHSIAPTKELRYSITFRTARLKNHPHSDLPAETEAGARGNPPLQREG